MCRDLLEAECSCRLGGKQFRKIQDQWLIFDWFAVCRAEAIQPPLRKPFLDTTPRVCRVSLDYDLFGRWGIFQCPDNSNQFSSIIRLIAWAAFRDVPVERPDLGKPTHNESREGGPWVIVAKPHTHSSHWIDLAIASARAIGEYLPPFTVV